MDMNRRTFLISTAATFFSTLVSGSVRAHAADLPFNVSGWQIGNPLDPNGPEPLPEVTAAVDVLVAADPDIKDDFTGSDYKADYVVAAALGALGQRAVVFFLNRHAMRLYGKRFLAGTEDQRLEAIKDWVRERDDMQPLLKELLTGLVTLSIIGTYENNTDAEQLALFTAMGWYDPEDPAGTFRLSNEGYPDSFQFPVRLKKGLKQ